MSISMRNNNIYGKPRIRPYSIYRYSVLTVPFVIRLIFRARKVLEIGYSLSEDDLHGTHATQLRQISANKEVNGA